MAKNIEMQYYNGSAYEVVYPKVNLSNVTGVLPLANGGTGATTLGTSAGANALIKLSEDKANMWYINTASGACYATAANGIPKFGTLPIAQGGTGATSASAALTALGAASASNLTSLTTRVSTLEGKSSPFYLELIKTISYDANNTTITMGTMTNCIGLMYWCNGGLGYQSNQGTGEVYITIDGVKYMRFTGMRSESSCGVFWRVNEDTGSGNQGHPTFMGNIGDTLELVDINTSETIKLCVETYSGYNTSGTVSLYKIMLSL